MCLSTNYGFSKLQSLLANNIFIQGHKAQCTLTQSEESTKLMSPGVSINGDTRANV